MKQIKLLLFIFISLVFSAPLFAEINSKSLGDSIYLGKKPIPAGGKSQVYISLEPLKPFAKSYWDINCTITNDARNSIVVKTGIIKIADAIWPIAVMNGIIIGSMMIEPQVSVKRGLNTLMIKAVDNKSFSILSFINFDNEKDLMLQCHATPSRT